MVDSVIYLSNHLAGPGLHEQVLVCDSFYSSHRSLHACFSASTFITSKLANFSPLHKETRNCHIKIVCVDESLYVHLENSCKVRELFR